MRLAFVRWNKQVCVCRECVIFSLFSEGFILEFDKKDKKMIVELAFAVCRITSCLMLFVCLFACLFAVVCWFCCCCG